MMLCDWRAGAGTLTLADGNKYVDCQQDGQGEARVARLRKFGGAARMDPVVLVRPCVGGGLRLARLLGLPPWGDGERFDPLVGPVATGGARGRWQCP